MPEDYSFSLLMYQLVDTDTSFEGYALGVHVQFLGDWMMFLFRKLQLP